MVSLAVRVGINIKFHISIDAELLSLMLSIFCIQHTCMATVTDQSDPIVVQKLYTYRCLVIVL